MTTLCLIHHRRLCSLISVFYSRKAADYCAEQERCISEIKLKFKVWKVDSATAELILDFLLKRVILMKNALPGHLQEASSGTLAGAIRN